MCGNNSFVIHRISLGFHLSSHILSAAMMTQSSKGWWHEYISHLPKEEFRKASSVITYIIYGAWKESNRRVFPNVALHIVGVMHQIRMEIGQRTIVHTNHPRDWANI